MEPPFRSSPDRSIEETFALPFCGTEKETQRRSDKADGKRAQELVALINDGDAEVKNLSDKMRDLEKDIPDLQRRYENALEEASDVFQNAVWSFREALVTVSEKAEVDQVLFDSLHQSDGRTQSEIENRAKQAARRFFKMDANNLEPADILVKGQPLISEAEGAFQLVQDIYNQLLKDESYTTEKVSASEGTEKQIVIRRGEEDRLSVAAGALIHVYQRRGAKTVAPAASFGVATGGDTVSYYAGPSVILGKERRWILTFGMSAAKVKRLGGGLEPGSEFSGEASKIPTENRYRLGAFAAFTFNLSGGSPQVSK